MALLAALAGPIAGIIDKLIPDKEEAAKAKMRLMELQQSGDLAELQTVADLAKGQMEVNKQEAAHKSLLVAGWRPGLGWVCVAGLGWQFVGYPLALFLVTVSGSDIIIPTAPTDNLMELVTAMLGLGALRTYEKLKRVSRER